MSDRSEESGMILVALLWIFIALCAIALSFARESHVGTVAVRNTQDLGKAYYIARASVSETIYRMAYERFAAQSSEMGTENESTFLEQGKIAGEFGGGRFQVQIQDESGKLDLNTASEEELFALMLAIEIPEDQAGIITDSILDWRDIDEEERTNGAEDGYYQSLETPYSARNGRLTAVEELLLVRGITPEYFYGIPVKTDAGSVDIQYGLSRCVTVYSSSTRTRINVNYAPIPVLISIPGIDRGLADRIIANGPYQNTADISDALPGTLSAETVQYLSTQLTDIYTLNVTASAENSKVRRTIRAVIRLDNSRPDFHQILYWNENVPDYEGTTL